MKQNRSIDSSELLCLFLPDGILDYFDVTDYDIMDSCYVIRLCEKNILPSEYACLPLVSKGFYPAITIQDFPARGGSVYLSIERRRWEDKSTGKSYSRNWNLVATGTRITAEFAYSGDARSPIPVISVHFLFGTYVTGGKINTFSSDFLRSYGKLSIKKVMETIWLCKVHLL